MKTLTQPLLVLLLFACVVSADEAITSATDRSYIRAIAYSVVALLALIALILALIA